MSNYFIREIVSGGQTGVDRAALDVAIDLEIPHGGWCPFGRMAEDGIIPSKYSLREAPAPTCEEKSDFDAIYKKRTELNARDSDGTLIIVKDEPIGGTLYTINMVEKHNKPYFLFKITDNIETEDIVSWIIKNNVRKLNVAGPRASQASGIYDSAYSIIHGLLHHDLVKKNHDFLTERVARRSKL